MMRAAFAAATLVLAFAGTTRGADAATRGYVDVQRLVAAHPLANVLAGYDRAIASLRNTQRAATRLDAVQLARRSSRQGASDASDAAQRVRTMSAYAYADRSREAAALAEVFALRGAGSDASGYAQALAQETSATFGAYQSATTLRASRALYVRRQQLREGELTLAFDLARRDAGTRTHLRLKITSPYLTRNERNVLQAQLDAMDRRENAALEALRRNDAAILAAYAGQLQHSAANDNAQMASELTAKADANRAVDRRVGAAEASARRAMPNLQSQRAAFQSAYPRDGAAVGDGLRAASGRITARFAQLAAAQRQSDASTAAQIRVLQDDRATLYREIVTQIERVAMQLARERRLAGIVTGATQPANSTDLTGAVRGALE